MEARIERALCQRMYLIDATPKDRDNWEFIVEGTTGSNYKLKMCDKMSCTCIDFKKRKKLCKHIIFIVCRVLKDSALLGRLDDDPNVRIYDLTDNLHGKLLAATTSTTTVVASTTTTVEHISGDDCAICFEELNELAITLHKCHGCTKYFHTECMTRWLCVKKNCPLCRIAIKKIGETSASATDSVDVNDALAKFTLQQVVTTTTSVVPDIVYTPMTLSTNPLVKGIFVIDDTPTTPSISHTPSV